MRRGILFLLLFTSSLSMAQDLTTDETFELGKEAWRQRRYPDALALFDQTLRMESDLYEVYRFRGSVYEQLDQPDKALQDYLVFMRQYPNNAEVLLAASTLRYRLKQYELAEEGFHRLLALPPGETEMVYFRQPVHGEGVTSLFTAQSNDKSGIYNYLGLCAQGKGDISAALDYLDTAIQIQPKNPDYYVNRGLAFQQTGQTARAEKDFEKALSIAPTHGLARYNLASLINASGDLEKATEFYSQSIEDNPSSPYGYRQRGYQHLLAGDHNLALRDFKKAISLDPDDAQTYVNLGITYEAKRLYQQALTSYSKAIDLKPDFPKAYLNRGNTLYRMKDYEQALNDYNVALIYQPTYGVAFYQRALTNYYLENYDKACDDINRAVELNIPQAKKARNRICSR